MRKYGVMYIQLHAFFTFILDGDDCSALLMANYPSIFTIYNDGGPQDHSVYSALAVIRTQIPCPYSP